MINITVAVEFVMILNEYTNVFSNSVLRVPKYYVYSKQIIFYI